MLGPEVVLVSRQLLHLDPLHLAGVGVVGELGLVLHELSDDVDGVAVLDADEGPGEALLQEGAGGGERREQTMCVCACPHYVATLRNSSRSA